MAAPIDTTASASRSPVPNEQLGKLPPSIAEHLGRRLELHWDSSFFELIVGRTLQELGADLEIEVANAEGFRPDYRARFPDGHVTVEAVRPQTIVR